MKVRFGMILDTESRVLQVGYQRYGGDTYWRRFTIDRQAPAKVRQWPRMSARNDDQGGA